jgi:2-oxoglutarate dehydrogenase E2 component (dihydrolipoamide succinyltransferase)
MPTDVIMPQMGESIFEGTITKWLKKPGDTVEKDEPLFEISTDKVDAEIPSPVAGILSEIKFAEGETVQINTVVAVIGGEIKAQLAAKPALPQAPAQAAPLPTAHLAAPQVPQSNAPQTPSGTNVVMPQMGESIFEGTITRWLKEVGQQVEKDEPLFEISTDKVDAEIPAPVAGILTSIKAPAGATVQINTVVAIIGGNSASGSADRALGANTSVASKSAAPQVPPKAQLVPPQVPQRSSPLVRRIAKENNLDLTNIPGTGSNGRITKEDILLYLSHNGPGSAAQAQSAAPQVPQAQHLTDELVPMSKMRSIIAQRMLESVRTSPHAYVVYKIDMTRVVRLREREKIDFYKRSGVKLTYMPFIAAAAADALRKFPIVNASLENGAIHYHQSTNLGIAVALEWGLIVPVVRQAETLSFVALARSIADLADRARTKKLKPDEASGSTFTLTNSGVFGGEFGTPIINQPESAILAIGGLKKEAVVLTDPEGNDTIAIRSMQHFCLGFDHRLIDGADASKFMLELQKSLENWDKPIA